MALPDREMVGRGRFYRKGDDVSQPSAALVDRPELFSGATVAMDIDDLGSDDLRVSAARAMVVRRSRTSRC
jgi:hypothetical protein